MNDRTEATFEEKAVAEDARYYNCEPDKSPRQFYDGAIWAEKQVTNGHKVPMTKENWKDTVAAVRMELARRSTTDLDTLAEDVAFLVLEDQYEWSEIYPDRECEPNTNA